MIIRSLLIILLIPIVVSAQFKNHSISDLATKRAEFSRTIKSLKDSISIIDLYMENLTREIDKSKLEVIYAMSNSPLRSQPNSSSDLIFRMARNAELCVIDRAGDFYYVSSAYGRGFVSKVLTSKEPLSLERKRKYTPLFESNYSSTKSKSGHNNSSGYSNNSSRYSRRTYYRGPRGGCYYINSKGNKTYVARDKCY